MCRLNTHMQAEHAHAHASGANVQKNAAIIIDPHHHTQYIYTTNITANFFLLDFFVIFLQD